MRSCSWRRKVFRAVRFPIIRSCGGRGRARPRRPRRCSDAPSAAICSCRFALAFVAAFYYVTNHFLGWWQPSESLTDPEILGSAVPALAPIAISLQAGFMEECLFRAVPLSLAALIGQRYGHRGVCDCDCRGRAGARVRRRSRQLSGLSVVFAPRRAFRAGDLVGAHLPALRADSDDPAARAVRPCADVDAAVPRSMRRAHSCLARSRHRSRARAARDRSRARGIARGSWSELPDALRNGAWQPPPAAHRHTAFRIRRPRIGGRRPRRAFAARAARPRRDWYSRVGAGDTVSRRRARARVDRAPTPRAIASAALVSRGVVLGPDWRQSSIVRLATDDPSRWEGHKFVWREAGRDAYAKLIGNVLVPPHWEVRYARFDGDVAERAEEWRVTIDGRARGAPDPACAAGIAARRAPFARRGARPRAEDRARAIRARSSVLKEVGAEEKQLPARVDWTFTFADPAAMWAPTARHASSCRSLATRWWRTAVTSTCPRRGNAPSASATEGRCSSRMALAALLGISGFVALVMAVIDWTHHRRDARALVGVAAIVFVLSVVGAANSWPVLAMSFGTTEPLARHGGFAGAARWPEWLVAALLLGLAAGVGVYAAAAAREARALPSLVPAWAAGVAAACSSRASVRSPRACCPNRFRHGRPSASSRSRCRGSVPRSRAFACSIATASRLFLLHWFAQLTAGWQRRGWLTALIAIAIFATLGLAAARATCSSAGRRRARRRRDGRGRLCAAAL